MGKVVALGLGAIGIILALLFVALSFGTDHWIEYVVDRGIELHSSVNNATYYGNPLYFSRDRGLFRTCYLGTETLCKFSGKNNRTWLSYPYARALFQFYQLLIWD